MSEGMTDPRKGIHPGEYISEEIEERGWSVKDFAAKVEWSERVAVEVIDGRLPISPTYAADLSRVFGTSRILWLRLQDAWQVAIQKD